MAFKNWADIWGDIWGAIWAEDGPAVSTAPVNPSVTIRDTVTPFVTIRDSVSPVVTLSR